MNYAIHGVVHSYPHFLCSETERDHSTRNEWLDTKETGEVRVKFKLSHPVSTNSQKEIFLPWKKIVLPDPLAPTAKK